ncbi:MAG: type II toxin-antitoxin system VapC family toxin [Actinomycetota bacterium]
MVGPQVPATFERAAPQAGAPRVGLCRRGSPLNVYADSSALVKAFIDEPGRDELLEIIAGATVVVTARLAYVETRAAFARAARERRLTRSEVRSASRAFDQRWTQLAIVELDDALAREAAALADTHPVRASDAIHLAAAVAVAADESHNVTFACWDARLWDEASKTGFIMGPVGRPA